MIKTSSGWIPNFVRRLVGTNCIYISTGKVSPYYDCVGCVIERAIACIDDMRQNKSGNVYPTCALKKSSEHANPKDCCPKIGFNMKGHKDLLYSGSAYPETLRCVERVGCSSSNIYLELEQECLRMCPPSQYKDQSGSGAACYAAFNSANSLYTKSLFSTLFLICMIITTVYFM
eukprot:gene12942-17350_t